MSERTAPVGSVSLPQTTADLHVFVQRLTSAQRDGRACVVCGADGFPLRPVGDLLGHQVAECHFHSWERANADNPPTWLTGPCPPWCADEHHAIDLPGDRLHGSPCLTVELRTMDYLNLGSPERPEFRPREMLMDLVQGYREIEPRICLNDNTDTFEVYLTLIEAERVSAHLSALVAQARDTPPAEHDSAGG